MTLHRQGAEGARPEGERRHRDRGVREGQALQPLYVERSYYLGPDKGGERAFALLVAAIEEEELVAMAQYAARGKDYLVALRPFEGRLLMHQLYHADEVRPVVGGAGGADARPSRRS